MAVAADDLLGTGPIVGREQDDRVVKVARVLELRQDTADLAVHPVDHRGVDRHLRGLEGLLLLGELVPRDRMALLARPTRCLSCASGKFQSGIVSGRADNAAVTIPSFRCRSQRWWRIRSQPSL